MPHPFTHTSPPPLILGLNPIHPDAAAALVGPGGIIAAIAEERLTRQKHSASFPSCAALEVCRIAGVTLADVTDVALAHDPSANLNAKVAFLSTHPAFARVPIGAPRTHAYSHADPGPSRHAEAEATLLAELSGARVHRVEHHKAHLASAFFPSPFERATAVSTDGSGDWCSGMTARCEGTEIHVLNRTHPPHSLGVLYTAVSGLLGFRRFSEEYKVMGLSALGEDRFADQMRELVTFEARSDAGGRGVRLATEFFSSGSALSAGDRDSFGELVRGELLLPRLWSDKMETLLGPARSPDAPIEARHRDIARSLQRRFETIMLEMVRDAVSLTGIRDLVLAGGCAHNAVANGRLLIEGVVDRLFVQPAAGDDGTALGAALSVLHQVHQRPRTPAMTGSYYGPSWSDAEIETALKGVSSRRLGTDELVRTCASAIAAGKVVGWFQGREEWGSRALGNRSILAHPGLPGIKDALNTRVKMREGFRPFAPAVLEERMSELYEGTHPVPFMNIVYATRPAWRERLSGVTHADGTGRVQSVSREGNPLFHALIAAFAALTGTPVLLNTSFNENEPIVHTPAEAVACFRRTRMDAMGIGPFWCEKG